MVSVIVCGICQCQLLHDPPAHSTELADRFTAMKTPPQRNHHHKKADFSASSPPPPPLPHSEQNEADIVALVCGHLYHNSCATEWFITIGQRKCPMCNTVTPVTDMIRVYPSTSTCHDSDSDLYLSSRHKSKTKSNTSIPSSNNNEGSLIEPGLHSQNQQQQGGEAGETSQSSINISVDSGQSYSPLIVDDNEDDRNRTSDINIDIVQHQEHQSTVTVSSAHAVQLLAANVTTQDTSTLTSNPHSSTSFSGSPSSSTTVNYETTVDASQVPTDNVNSIPPVPANSTIHRTERIVNNIRTIFYRFISSTSNGSNSGGEAGSNNNSNNYARSINTDRDTPGTSRERWRSALRQDRRENPDHSRSPNRPCRNCSALKRVMVLMERDLATLRNRVADLRDALEEEKRHPERMVGVMEHGPSARATGTGTEHRLNS